MRPKFQCHICKKLLSRSTTLRAHLRTHSGEKPFACSACTKAFARPWDLHQHQKTHGATRKYACKSDVPMRPGCGTRFHRKRDLKRHLRNSKNAKCIPLNQLPSCAQNDAAFAAAQTLTQLREAPMDDGVQATISGVSTSDSIASEPMALDKGPGHVADETSCVSATGVDDTSDVADAIASLKSILVPLFNEVTLFRRLVLALYRVASLTTQRQSIETDVTGWDIRRNALVDLRNALSRPSTDSHGVLLSIAIFVVMETLLRPGSGYSRAIHISALSHFPPVLDRSPLVNLAGGISHIIAPGPDGMIKLVVTSSCLCKPGLLSSGAFATILASIMFNCEALLNIPQLVEQAAALEDSIQSRLGAPNDQRHYSPNNPGIEGRNLATQVTASQLNERGPFATHCSNASRHSALSISVASPSTQRMVLDPTARDWRDRNSTIIHLITEKNLSLRDLMSILEDRYGFKESRVLHLP